MIFAYQRAVEAESKKKKTDVLTVRWEQRGGGVCVCGSYFNDTNATRTLPITLAATVLFRKCSSATHLAAKNPIQGGSCDSKRRKRLPARPHAAAEDALTTCTFYWYAVTFSRNHFPHHPMHERDRPHYAAEKMVRNTKHALHKGRIFWRISNIKKMYFELLRPLLASGHGSIMSIHVLLWWSENERETLNKKSSKLLTFSVRI